MKTSTFPAKPKADLGDEQLRIGLKGGTEPAFSEGNSNKETRTGSYSCVGCDRTLFRSGHKFDSGTGWPSFWQPADPSVIGTRADYKMILPRTEVHCTNCGFHLGHVFKDGPEPTGLRYCINGAVLAFHPGSE